MKEEIEKALAVLKEEGTLLYPTDTIWGLGCDATSQEAIEKIYDLKKRPSSKSFIILLDDDRKLNKYIKDIPEVAWDLLDATEDPLTIIYPGAINLPKNLIAEDESIAIRIVKDGFVHQLIRKLNKPLVSTSANISGASSALSLSEVAKEIKEGVNYIANVEQNCSGKASSIIKLQIDGQIEIIRK